MVPVNNGYNLAQSGVGWTVQSATMMASAVWTRAATALLSDDLPIAQSSSNFDPKLITTLY